MDISWSLYALLCTLCYSFATLFNAIVLKRVKDRYSVTVVIMGVCAIFFTSLWAYQGFNIPTGTPILIIIFALFINVTGWFSETAGLNFAPNPGYYSSIKAGQAMIVIPLSWLFFEGADINLMRSIFVIVIFLGVVGVSTYGSKPKKEHAEGKYPWQVYGFGALISFALLTTSIKGISASQDNFGEFDPVFLGVLLTTGTFTAMLLVGVREGKKLQVKGVISFMLVMGALLASLGQIFDYAAISASPNAGYVAAIKGAQMMLITLLSPLFVVGAEISFQKVLFVIVIFLGVSGLVLV